MNTSNLPPKHIRLTRHPRHNDGAPNIHWGAMDAATRGPVIATHEKEEHRNAVGAHSGAYMMYRALAIAAGTLDPVHVPDLTNTSPAAHIGPFPQWSNPERIVSIDPYGHLIGEAFKAELEAGMDIRPTIAVTAAHIDLPETRAAIAAGRLVVDGSIVTERGDVRVTKAAIEPVWYLPGIAERFGVTEASLRRALYEHSGSMFTELVTRSDLKVFLPPIGGVTVYLFGDVSKLGNSKTRIACRVHDECNGSDVFGSDICTCRPYLAHGIEECIANAQGGGVGVIVYNRKEGRALGEVTKFLVYNARKRQPGGDRAETYFRRTECVAGVEDMRFQELMPDVLHWLGISRIDRFMSMSDMKYDSVTRSGIEVVDRVEIPAELIPDDARVEMDAKRAAGYFTDTPVAPETLTEAHGRKLHE